MELFQKKERLKFHTGGFMKNQFEAMSLNQEKNSLEQKLESFIYGAIEIREKNDNKYIYVNYRKNGKKISKYIDKYNEELHNLI